MSAHPQNVAISLVNTTIIWLDPVVAYVRRRPGTTLAILLGLHLLVWTALPVLLGQSLPLDAVEGLALGKEWQLGYWKHPPLAWWLDDLAYRTSGTTTVVFLLGPLSTVACMYLLWRFAREVVEPISALIAVLSLESIHFFNYSAVQFNQNVIQLPFWVLTSWFFYRAVIDARNIDWLLAGIFLALTFWSKYSAVALAGTLALMLLTDPLARKSWRTPGPYLMAMAVIVVLYPNLQWLFDNGFLPFHYAKDRAVAVSRWYEYLWFPLRWSFIQLFYLIPMLILLAVSFLGTRLRDAPANFPRRYVMALAFGPFALTTVAAMMFGRLPIPMWGYPLWTFLPLAVVMWCKPIDDTARTQRFAATFLLLFVAAPTAFVVADLAVPLVRERPKASQFPSKLLAETITRQWRERTGTPLFYVGGADLPPSAGPGEFAANTVAVYSPDRPHVIVHGELRLSPWVDREDMERRGLVLVWQAEGPPRLPDNLRMNFPRAELQPSLLLPRRLHYPGKPEVIGFAFVPPRPQ
jgi:hypothetical protein